MTEWIERGGIDVEIGLMSGDEGMTFPIKGTVGFLPRRGDHFQVGDGKRYRVDDVLWILDPETGKFKVEVRLE